MSKKEELGAGEIIFGEIRETDIFGDSIEESTESVIEDISNKKEEKKTEEKSPKEVANDEQITDAQKIAIEKQKKEEDANLESITDLLDEEETDTKKDKQADNKNTSYYYNAMTSLIEEGIWEEFDAGEVDLESMDEDMFKTIVKNQKKWKQEKLKKEALNALDEEEREYLDFKKGGGDLRKFTQSYNFKKQAEELDLSTDIGKKSTVYSYYKNIVGWEEDKVMKYLQKIEKDLELDDEAVEAKSKLEAIAKKQYENVLAEQKQQEAAIKEAQLNYKKSIAKQLDEVGLDKSKSTSIVKSFTEVDKKGYTEIDQAFLSFRNDPEKAYVLWQMLMNHDDFVKDKVEDLTSKKNLETFKKIKFHKKNSDSSVDKEEETRRKESINENEYILEF